MALTTFGELPLAEITTSTSPARIRVLQLLAEDVLVAEVVGERRQDRRVVVQAVMRNRRMFGPMVFFARSAAMWLAVDALRRCRP